MEFISKYFQPLVNSGNPLQRVLWRGNRGQGALLHKPKTSGGQNVFFDGRPGSSEPLHLSLVACPVWRLLDCLFKLTPWCNLTTGRCSRPCEAPSSNWGVEQRCRFTNPIIIENQHLFYYRWHINRRRRDPCWLPKDSCSRESFWATGDLFVIVVIFAMFLILGKGPQKM